MPDPQKSRSKIVDFIHITGSIASVTGISLLWIKDLIHAPSLVLLVAIPVIITATFLSFGLAFFAFALVRYGYRTFALKEDFAWKAIYLCFSIAAALIFFFCFAALIWTYAVALAQGYF